MANNRASVETKTVGPSYIGWRGELLAELALARLPELIVHKKPAQAPFEVPYDYLVATPRGSCFYVAARAFSSRELGIPDVQAVCELPWSLDADLLRYAANSPIPFVLFLFDADTDHGRYLRLDTLPVPEKHVRRVIVRLPVEHTINRENLEELVKKLPATAKK